MASVASGFNRQGFNQLSLGGVLPDDVCFARTSSGMRVVFSVRRTAFFDQQSVASVTDARWTASIQRSVHIAAPSVSGTVLQPAARMSMGSAQVTSQSGMTGLFSRFAHAVFVSAAVHAGSGMHGEFHRLRAVFDVRVAGQADISVLLHRLRELSGAAQSESDLNISIFRWVSSQGLAAHVLSGASAVIAYPVCGRATTIMYDPHITYIICGGLYK